MGEAYFDDSVEAPEGLTRLFARSTISLTIADATQEDCPLVGVNSTFLDLIGYQPAEVLGRNCRFLQLPEGAGPVRDRIKRFLSDPEKHTARFLLPNRSKSGERFLNLLFMTKIAKGSTHRLILGSQFAVGARSEAMAQLYDRALKEDIRQLNLLTNETNWVVLDTYEALASSYSIIARSHLE